MSMTSADSPKRRVSLARWIIGLIILVPIAGFWAMLMMGDIRTFKVISGSMEPTLQAGDFVFMKSPKANPDLRAKVIVFRNPGTEGDEEILTKRVVALGGDTVLLRSGRVEINGRPDSYNVDDFRHMGDRSIQVPPGHVFVLGDNRNNSYDSLNFGTFPAEEVMGVLTWRYWPLARRGPVR